MVFTIGHRKEYTEKKQDKTIQTSLMTREKRYKHRTMHNALHHNVQYTSMISQCYLKSF